MDEASKTVGGTKMRKEDRALTRRIARAQKAAQALRFELSELTRMARDLGCHDEAIGALKLATEAARKTCGWVRESHSESLELV